MAERDREGQSVVGPPLGAIFLTAVAARNLASRGESRPLRALEVADRMRAQGRNDRAIYHETNKILVGTEYAGVSYDAADKPRFEVSDAGAKLRPAALDRSGQGFVGQMLPHPELSRALPERDFVPIVKSGTDAGGFTGDRVLLGEQNFSRGGLGGRPIAKPAARGVILHEDQHVAQVLEDRPTGGTPDDFEKPFPGEKNRDTRVKLYRALAGEQEAELTRASADMTAEQRRAVHPDDRRYPNRLDRSEQIVTYGDGRMAMADVEDFGEKIGGARKDKATKTRARAKSDQPADTRPGWAKRFVAAETLKGGKPTGEWTLLDTRRKNKWTGGSAAATRQTFPSQAAAEQAIPALAVAQKHYVRSAADGKYEVWRKVSDRKSVKASAETFASRDAAIEHMARNAETLLGSARGYGEEILARPEKVSRSGPAFRQGDVAPNQFLTDFKFRGVEFGNWQNERQSVMNMAYDAMRDLSDITGIAPESLTLQQRLGLAFGARGNGGVHGGAAHYERAYAAVNLTRENGAGHLAHEWMHALDHYLGTLDDPRLGETTVDAHGNRVFRTAGRDTDYASHRVTGSGQLPDAVRSAYRKLVDTMLKKPEQVTVDVARHERAVERARTGLAETIQSLRSSLEQQVPYGKRNVAPASAEQLRRFDEIAAKLLAGESLDVEWKFAGDPSARLGSRGSMTYRYTGEALDALSNLYKDVRGRSGFDNQNRGGPMDRLANAMRATKSAMTQLGEAQKSPTATVMTHTNFVREAVKLDEARSTPYWNTRHELVARAFSAYIEDKMRAAGRSSDYLSFGSDNTFYEVFKGVRPFPEGTERAAINQAFDGLFEAMKQAEVLRPGASTAASTALSATNDVATAMRGTTGQQGWQDEARQASAEARATTETPTAKPKRTRKAADPKPARAAVAGDNGGPSDQAIKTAAKLEQVAKRTAERAEQAANQPRLMNTARRARLGSGVIDDANAQRAQAETALKIAEALRNGEAGSLKGVRSLADVRALSSLYRSAMHEADRVLNRRYEAGKTPTPADIDYAQMPKAFIRTSRGEVDGYKTLLAGKKGFANDLKLLERHSISADGRGNYGTDDARVIEATKRVAKAVLDAGGRHEKWQAGRLLEEIRDYERVRGLGIDNVQSLRAVLRDYVAVRVGKRGIDPVKAAERDLIGVKLPGFFPTPESLAARMAEMADIQPGQTVLEPSAGTGRLADAAKARGAAVSVVEMQSRLRDILAKKGHDIIASDFTEMPAAPAYDRIVMNPPFEKGQDMAHVKRAYEMLKPGGRMVAVMGEGAFFRNDSTASGFRTWLESVGGSSEKLPDGTFKESNTGVNTRLVVIEKPASTGQNPGWSDAAREASAQVRAANAEMKPGDHVRVRQGDGSQSEAGKIVPNHKSWKGKTPPAGYHTIRFADGGSMMVHESDLMRSGTPNDAGVTARPGAQKPAPKPPVQSAVERAMATSAAKGQQTQSTLAQPGSANPKKVYSEATKQPVRKPADRAKERADFTAKAGVRPLESGGFEVTAPDGTKHVSSAGTATAAKMTVFAKIMAANNKLGAFAMIGAPVAAAVVAFDATRSEAKAAGADTATANTQAAMAAAGAGGVTAGVVYVAGKAIGLGLKGIAKVAPLAAGPAGIAVAVGLTAWGAHRAYQEHKDKGLGGVAAVASLAGLDQAVHLMKPREQSAGPQRLTAEQAQSFATANEAHKAMQSAEPTGVVKSFDRTRTTPSGTVVHETVKQHRRAVQ